MTLTGWRTPNCSWTKHTQQQRSPVGVLQTAHGQSTHNNGAHRLAYSRVLMDSSREEATGDSVAMMHVLVRPPAP